MVWVVVCGLAGSGANGKEPSGPAPLRPGRVAGAGTPKTVPVASRDSSVDFPPRAAHVHAPNPSKSQDHTENQNPTNQNPTSQNPTSHEALHGGAQVERPDQPPAVDGGELFVDRAIKTIQQIVEQEMGDGVVVGQWNYVNRRAGLVWPWQEQGACHDLSAYQPVDCGPINWRRPTAGEGDSRSDAVVGTAPRRVKSWPR